MKETILKSVTAIICVVILCITSSVAVGNYSDAVKEAAKLTGTVSSSGGSATGEVTPDAGEVTPDAGEVTPEDTSEVTPDAGEVTPDAGEATPDAGNTGSTANTDKPASTNAATSSDMTAAQFATFINAETAKIAAKPSYKFKRVCSYTDPIDVGSATNTLNKIIQGIDENSNLDTVVGGFLGIGTKEGTLPKDELSDNYKIKATKLQASDLGSFKASNGVYTFTLANATNPKKTNATPISKFTNDFITHEEVVKGISDFTSLIKVNSTTVNYKNVKVTVTVAGGKITEMKYSYAFDAKLTLKAIFEINGSGAAVTNATYSSIKY